MAKKWLVYVKIDEGGNRVICSQLAKEHWEDFKRLKYGLPSLFKAALYSGIYVPRWTRRGGGPADFPYQIGPSPPCPTRWVRRYMYPADIMAVIRATVGDYADEDHEDQTPTNEQSRNADEDDDPVAVLMEKKAAAIATLHNFVIEHPQHLPDVEDGLFRWECKSAAPSWNLAYYTLRCQACGESIGPDIMIWTAEGGPYYRPPTEEEKEIWSRLKIEHLKVCPA